MADDVKAWSKDSSTTTASKRCIRRVNFRLISKAAKSGNDS
jgi:hypothetical protein